MPNNSNLWGEVYTLWANAEFTWGELELIQSIHPNFNGGISS